ncbi:MAG TPA: amidohydrolase family protein [Vicinamibacterales bacterium]|nr:amidohydrolase family protein [Vicinamibacterales bacterium]
MPRPTLALVLAAAVWLAPQPPQPSPGFDVLIQNGRVMDGSGNPWIRADVGIRGDTIVAVRPLPGARATRVIDAGDRLVTPGFIDVHSHAAEGLVRKALRQGQPLIAQGVTTIVGNPDGGGEVDLAGQRAALETGGLGPNVALLIGHGSVRRSVMGGASRPPTSDELERMRALVRRGMEQGAFGLSSGLFYTPGSFATTEEVIELAKVAGEHGGLYTSHIRDEGSYNVGVVASVQEVIRIAEEAKTVGIVSHVKALGPDSWGLAHVITQRVDAARARGVQVFTDQYAYEASSTSLSAALLPDGVPAPSAEHLAIPGSMTAAQRAVFEAAERLATENLRRRGGASAIQFAHYRPDPAREGKTLAQVAAGTGRTPVLEALDMIARGGASIVSFNMSEADIAHLMRQTYTMTSSDGGLVLPTEGKPHPRNYGAFARKLSLYSRERGVVTLEHAVRSMTSLPASVFGMHDRGVLREGAAADIAIFDLSKIVEKSTYTDPHHHAEGMHYVLINGQVVVADGKFTAALPGKVLRKFP